MNKDSEILWILCGAMMANAEYRKSSSLWSEIATGTGLKLSQEAMQLLDLLQRNNRQGVKEFVKQRYLTNEGFRGSEDCVGALQRSLHEKICVTRCTRAMENMLGVGKNTSLADFLDYADSQLAPLRVLQAKESRNGESAPESDRSGSNGEKTDAGG